MKATARRITNHSFTHRVDVRHHQLTVEFSPAERGVPVEFDIVCGSRTS
jgi:hypothetical protein